MTYLLDTCLISEMWRPSPNRGVVEWLSGSLEEDLFLSVLSLGEIKKGVGRLADGKKKDRLLRDYALLRGRFAHRVLPIDDSVAERWGDLAATAARAGRELHVVDGLIAATALLHGFSLVSRNVGDFAATPVPVVNPWT
jgi:toxin FitB